MSVFVPKHAPSPVDILPMFHLLLFLDFSSRIQTEKAFQKQKGVFLNKKKFFVTQGPKKEPRFVRNVGLGFKTPREVSGC